MIDRRQRYFPLQKLYQFHSFPMFPSISTRYAVTKAENILQRKNDFGVLNRYKTFKFYVAVSLSSWFFYVRACK